MRVLHVLKTSSGGDWAARQVSELVKLGVDVHVLLPDGEGSTAGLWKQSGATLHFAQLDFPVRTPWELSSRLARAREMVTLVAPDIIHSHFVGTTLTLRLALGRDHHIPRIFQVPGPLHLENNFFRRMEISSAGNADFWLASSQYIRGLYEKSGVASDRLSLSYYGLSFGNEGDEKSVANRVDLRSSLGLPKNAKLVTNVSHMYAPKYYLGQTTGLKCHEDLIDALAIVTRKRADVFGLIVGGAWGRSKSYEISLRDRASREAGDRIRFLGTRPHAEISGIWTQSDLAVHVPLSENCGGVVEPLLADVPVIASRVGGIPEVVIDGVTGALVEARQPPALAEKILEVLGDLPAAKRKAVKGKLLVKDKFEIKKIVRELIPLYENILHKREGRVAS